MPIHCILKENIGKLKGVIKGLSDANQLEKLINLDTESRIKLFEKAVSGEEAKLLISSGRSEENEPLCSTTGYERTSIMLPG
jgi:hypothetical protein